MTGIKNFCSNWKWHLRTVEEDVWIPSGNKPRRRSQEKKGTADACVDVETYPWKDDGNLQKGPNCCKKSLRTWKHGLSRHCDTRTCSWHPAGKVSEKVIMSSMIPRYWQQRADVKCTKSRLAGSTYYNMGLLSLEAPVVLNFLVMLKNYDVSISGNALQLGLD